MSNDKQSQEEITAKNTFSQWVYRLEGKVIALEEIISHGDAQRITRQLETYKSEVQQLYDHANKHAIDISAYGTHFARIYQHIYSLEEKLKQRAQHQRQFPLYAILHVIGNIASIIMSFFNPLIANAIDRVTLLLPGEHGPKTWLIPEQATSLQSQPYTPRPLQQPLVVLPPSRFQAPLSSQPPAVRSPLLNPQKLNLLKRPATPTTSTSAQSGLVNPASTFPIAGNKPFLPTKRVQASFISTIPCKTCGVKPTAYATPTPPRLNGGYYCRKHFPQQK
ncbi:MAG TPA: hypothetical protein VFN35_13065 [Ktedonobacteraceae bacterium]|nr:hypothetical protein [Ktedonobacteraceae bacterium]